MLNLIFEFAALGYRVTNAYADGVVLMIKGTGESLFIRADCSTKWNAPAYS
jgi:hypothetical protein